MIEKVLWVFGDSFCSHNDNWIKQIQKWGEYKTVNIISLPGSSLPYTLEKLYENVGKIKQSDSVIVGMTDHSRQYLSKFHLRPHVDEKKVLEYPPKTKDDIVDSRISSVYDSYLHYFFDDFQALKQLIPTYDFIANHIPKLIKTEKYVSFYTMYRNPINVSSEPKRSTKYKEFLPIYKNILPPSDYPGMWEAAEKFTEFNNLSPESYYRTPNHWIDSKEYEEYFWNIYKSLFDILWQKY